MLLHRALKQLTEGVTTSTLNRKFPPGRQPILWSTVTNTSCQPWPTPHVGLAALNPIAKSTVNWHHSECTHLSQTTSDDCIPVSYIIFYIQDENNKTGYEIWHYLNLIMSWRHLIGSLLICQTNVCMSEPNIPSSNPVPRACHQCLRKLPSIGCAFCR